MNPLKILHLEDNHLDASLAEATLAGDGIEAEFVRVDNRDGFSAALKSEIFDVIIADYNLPVFDGLSAQVLAAQLQPEIPFIFLSGSIGEETAIERLKAGATDYVLKDRMARLPAAVRRALAETAERSERRRAEESVGRLNAELESRVIERTADLARANDALAVRESELGETKSFLEDLIAASPSMIFRLDPVTFDVIYASPNVGWLLGYTDDEVVQFRDFWAQHIHPDDRVRVLGERTKGLAENAVQIEQEFRLRGKDDRYTWFFSLMRVEYDAAMRPTTILRYCLDIADRKAAQEALLESEERTRAILRTANDAFIGMDHEGRIVEWNERAESLFGWTRLEAIGRTVEDLVVPDRYRAAHRQRLASWVDTPKGGLQNKRLDLLALTRDGSECPVELTVWDSGAGNQRTFNVFVRDITEQKAAAAAVRLAREEAERANRAKSDFLSRMSHDLRTPLSAILGFAQLLELDDVGESAKESVAHILRGGQHLLALINEVLDIARIEAGHLALSPEPVDAAEIVALAVELVRPLAAQRSISVVLDPPAAGVVVLADRQRLNQVLLNLLSNAVKYNREGGRVTVSFGAVDGGRLRITVTDTGAGMPPAKLKLLFQPFERLGAEQTGVEGTGLGLALSRGLAEAMGGTLGVTSVVDQGSIFWLELALTDAPAAPGEPIRAHAATEGAVAPSTTGVLLYIEDNVSNVRLMERVLERRPGIRLVHAARGEDGLRLAREERPDLIFMDLHLPDMSGEDVLRRLRENPALRLIPVAVLSADATPEQSRNMKASGAIAYLTKPLEISQIMQLLDERLAAVAPQATGTVIVDRRAAVPGP